MGWSQFRCLVSLLRWKPSTLIVSTAGTRSPRTSTGALMKELLREQPDLGLKDVADYPPKGNDWEILLADSKGVYEMTPGGGLIKMTVRQGYSYGVIGSGSGPALGSLYSWRDGPIALMSALRAAEAHTNHVRRPFKVINL